jgi:hypothetical protein
MSGAIEYVEQQYAKLGINTEETQQPKKGDWDNVIWWNSVTIPAASMEHRKCQLCTIDLANFEPAQYDLEIFERPVYRTKEQIDLEREKPPTDRARCIRKCLWWEWFSEKRQVKKAIYMKTAAKEKIINDKVKSELRQIQTEELALLAKKKAKSKSK